MGIFSTFHITDLSFSPVSRAEIVAAEILLTQFYLAGGSLVVKQWKQWGREEEQ